ncbi:hypothetical protein JXO52_08085 [bacterium]|nr:hypothetical protein [bacterium]
MAAISKIAFSTSLLFAFVMLCTFFIGTGCEQILDEALQQQIPVEEELFSSQSHEETDGLRIPVTGDYRLRGPGAASFSKPGASAFLVVPSDAPLFAWVCSEAGGALQGRLVNNGEDAVELTVSLGLDDDAEGAMVIGSVTAAGQETNQFSIDGSAFEAFFDGLFADRIQEFYLFLAAEGNGSIDLTVQTLEFVLQPAQVIRREIGPLSDVGGASGIELTGDVSLSGTIHNRSGGTLQMLLVLAPATPAASWDGMEIACEIPAGGSVDLSQWTGLVTGDQLDALEEMLVYLGTGTIAAELYTTAAAGLRYEIVSILVSGSVSLTA